VKRHKVNRLLGVQDAHSRVQAEGVGEAWVFMLPRPRRDPVVLPLWQ
jgi:hypothetical protein